MKQEDKDLSIKDFCARLPYDVKCKILETNETKILASVNYDRENTLFDFWEDERKIQYEYQLYLSEFKPYLFPLSSMTEEQKEEYVHILAMNSNLAYSQLLGMTVEDWFNKNHFDFRGLIQRGLAIDCTNLNIY